MDCDTLRFLGDPMTISRLGVTHSDALYSAKHPLPIFTLQTLGTKIYVVNSPDLIQAVQRHAKVLTFNPFVSFMSPRIFDCGAEAMRIINENIGGEMGNWGLLPDTSRGMHNALAPSESLDWMTRTMLSKFMEYLLSLIHI